MLIRNNKKLQQSIHSLVSVNPHSHFSWQSDWINVNHPLGTIHIHWTHLVCATVGLLSKNPKWFNYLGAWIWSKSSQQLVNGSLDYRKSAHLDFGVVQDESPWMLEENTRWIISSLETNIEQDGNTEKMERVFKMICHQGILNVHSKFNSRVTKIISDMLIQTTVLDIHRHCLPLSKYKDKMALSIPWPT